MPYRLNCLFKVLDLLANFLQLRLAGDNALRNSGVVGLGAESIEFAKNLLNDEFKRPADRLAFAQMMRELREMTFQTRQFLRDVGTVGEKGNFLHETFVVGRDWQSGFLNALEERGPISFHYFGVKGADFLELFAHRFEPMDQVFGEMSAFALA